MATRCVARFARAALAVLAVVGATVRGEEPPNFVLIIADDAAWTDYGFMGHPHIRTPNLDRLAAEGVVFTRGYVPSSLCCPSLATMITGLYPHEHGITGNEPARAPGVDRSSPGYRDAVAEMVAMIDGTPTLPALLTERGYLSLQTGKWWLGGFERGGFTHGMTHGDPDRGGRHGDEGLRIGRQTMRPVEEFLDQAAGRPFFVWYAPFLPHTPHNPPARLLERYLEIAPTERVARYWACCEWLDETCGELLGLLDARGLAERTMVVLVTDNGWIQRPNESGYAERSKRSPYEGGLRTPIVVRWPGRVSPGRVETPVSAIDIAPTILAAAGVEAPAGTRGVDLLDASAVAGRGPGLRRRAPAQRPRSARSRREPDAPLDRRGSVEAHRAARVQRAWWRDRAL